MATLLMVLPSRMGGRRTDLPFERRAELSFERGTRLSPEWLTAFALESRLPPMITCIMHFLSDDSQCAVFHLRDGF